MIERPADTVIETPRVWLREWRDSDHDDFRYIVTDPEMMRFIRQGQLWTDDEIAFFIDRERTRYAAHGFCLWPAVLKETGELIGQCGLKQLGATGMIEIGWWIATRYWGRGIATEAARAVLEAGFTQHRLERIVAIAHPANGASVRIMEKLGMRFVRRVMRPEFGLAGDEPIVLYEIEAAKEQAIG